MLSLVLFVSLFAVTQADAAHVHKWKHLRYETRNSSEHWKVEKCSTCGKTQKKKTALHNFSTKYKKSSYGTHYIVKSCKNCGYSTQSRKACSGVCTYTNKNQTTHYCKTTCKYCSASLTTIENHKWKGSKGKRQCSKCGRRDARG